MNLLIEAPDDFGHATITFIWTPLLGSTIALWTPNPLHRGEGGGGGQGIGIQVSKIYHFPAPFSMKTI